MTRLILASTSVYRRALLERLRVPFDCAAPSYEEDNPPDAEPRALVEAHAIGKARSVADRLGGGDSAFIIGSDQVMVLDGRVLGKPGAKSAALKQLQSMSGREHELVTAIAIVATNSDRMLTHVEVSPIGVRDLTEDEITHYVETENPIDCAGSYKCEGLGVSLFEYQRGDDPTAVIGLPLIALSRLLRELGFLIP